MEKIKAIIVDDELAARKIMVNLLELSHPEIQVLQTFDNLLEAVSAIKKEVPDIVFLDVEMPQYSGYEIVNFFDEINFQIVFVTAYDKYAIKAFEVNAVDYLLKPIKRERLAEAVERIKSNIEEQVALADYTNMLDDIRNEDSPKIVLSELGKKEWVKTRDIIAVEARGAYATIFLKDGRTTMVSKNIGTIEKSLQIDPLFFRSHKSWIINMTEVFTYKIPEETIVLKNGISVKLSRFKKAEFKLKLKELL